ncbi:MAG: ADP-ribosylglycohydrolase family protein [Chitinivibrionales bacterium]|nr:ADP-ribosylglycohydrolase family protein [Chitinivibrionales bacterium]
MEAGLSVVPTNCEIYKTTQQVREWRAAEPDWHATRRKIDREFPYSRYGGGCPIVPNNAIITLALLYAGNSFRRALLISTSAGFDTDCNVSAVGCFMAIKNGLDSINAEADFRGPVEDRLFLSTVDGGRAITDALTETYRIVNIGRSLHGEEPLAPKKGARFHFSLPGSVQGFRIEPGHEHRALLTNRNKRLEIRLQPAETDTPVRMSTATFTRPEDIASMKGPKLEPNSSAGWVYNLLASPTLYPGQIVTAHVLAPHDNTDAVECKLFIRCYGENDTLFKVDGPQIPLAPGAGHTFTWKIPDIKDAPVAETGLELTAHNSNTQALMLDYLSWSNTPEVTFTHPPYSATMWMHAWVNAVDLWRTSRRGCFWIFKDFGRGMIIQGTREWRNYAVSSTVTTDCAKSFGVAAYVQGMFRYYALLLCDDRKLRLIKMLERETVLAETDSDWDIHHANELSLSISNGNLRGSINGSEIIAAVDTVHPLDSGGIALVVEEGHLLTDAVTVMPEANR